MRYAALPERHGIPRVFVGTIASSNAVIKHAEKRKAIAANVLGNGHALCCIEMEGAGVQDAAWLGNVGYLVVRGTCDYCNKNKGGEWQKYAAIIAAAFSRSVIEDEAAKNQEVRSSAFTRHTMDP